MRNRKVRGTDSIKVSIANQEVVPPKPEGWTIGHTFYAFSFINKQPCTVVINGDVENPIFLDTEQGFERLEIYQPIESFVIREAGIEYQFIGA